MIRAALISLALAAPAAAQDLRPAPAYFVDAVFALEAAELVAKNCPTLEINKSRLDENKRWTERKLRDDGFDTANPRAQMIDFSGTINARWQDVRDRHPIESGQSDAFCAAGKYEIAQKSLVGALLKVVAQ